MEVHQLHDPCPLGHILFLHPCPEEGQTSPALEQRTQEKQRGSGTARPAKLDSWVGP